CAICYALRFDSVLAVAIALTGSAAGFTAALTNTFTLSMSKEIGGVELYSGIVFISITIIIMTLIAIIFVTLYARKIEKEPEKSITYEIDQKKIKNVDNVETTKFTLRLKFVTLIAILGFITLIIGILQFDWYLKEIDAIFIITAVLSGIVAGFNIKIGRASCRERG